MKSVAMETADDTISQANDEPLVSLRVYIPELLVQKCMQFHRDDLVWDIKQQIISSLSKELKESHNYGLFSPPVNGKAGKFLDEQRPLGDYPFPETVGYLELRYKRRVYKMMNMEEKQIKQLHTRANLRRMLEYVNNGQVEKITKMCARGLDPNFHCPDTGETPLSLATALKQPAKVIMALVNGGALLDFRTKDGHTALHHSVEKNNFDALKTLLDLGASPNYKDSRGLSPLYYTLLYASDAQLTELLLHDHALIGSTDPQGWQEVHQACKHGLVQHLEHLLFYGADMNARNASGNTPLHVCAVNDQESCARVLLFRGADKNALNFANQNPYQVAVIAGNLNLAEIIKSHSPDDVVPYREAPRYNPRRRASVATVAALSRTHSDPRLELALGGKPPSPCPSNCSLPPFSSVSCISEASTGSSTCTQPSGEDSEDTASTSVVTEKSVTSDSSGVCTSNSGASYESCTDQPDPIESPLLPGTTCVCIKDYHVPTPGHLQLSCGYTLEIISAQDNDLLEGRTSDGQEGLFPSSCVQEVTLRNVENMSPSSRPRVEGRRELNAKKVNTIPRRWKIDCIFRFGEPRTVILHKGKKGFGFVLRGAKATSPLMERQPSEFWPSLQYLDDVDKGGIADMAGLKKGDFLLEINGQDVSQASHEHVVTIIRQSGDLVAMTVVTVQAPPVGTPSGKPPLLPRQFATLPRKLSSKKAPVPPRRDPRTTLSVGRAQARSMVAGLAEIEVLDRTLNEYDSEGRSTKSSSIESIPNKPGVSTSDSNVPKLASIRSRPSSRRITATELEEFFARQESARHSKNFHTLTHQSATMTRTPKVYGSVAAMKRSKASRIKIADIMGKLHKEFHSTPDLNINASESDSPTVSIEPPKKRSQSQEDFLNMVNNRHSWACSPHGYNEPLGISDHDTFSCYHNSWRSIEDVYNKMKSEEKGISPIIVKEDASEIYAQTLPLTRKEKPLRSSCPPPSHPPPPPPLGQVVKVDVSRSLGEYANVNVIHEQKSTVMSSFRPGDSAKLYASPEVVMSVGYKTDPLPERKMLHPRRVGGGSSLRSHSLPPKISGSKTGSRSTTSSEAENSGDSGGLYSTFKMPHRQRGSLSSDSGHVSDRGTLRSLKGKPTIATTYASKFEVEDSDVGTPQHYPTLRTPCHEPFIPEPDYESSEDDDIPTSLDKGGSLSTFGKGSTTQEVITRPHSAGEIKLSEETQAVSPHMEAKRAIQEARERLRYSHKSSDKNATVVFISGKITDKKIEKSDIHIHRTEEGTLKGTVVISTKDEKQEPIYLSSPLLNKAGSHRKLFTDQHDKEALTEEHSSFKMKSTINKERRKSSYNPSTSDYNNITEGESCKDENQIPDDIVQESKHVSEEKSEMLKNEKLSSTLPRTDGLRIVLTGAETKSASSFERRDFAKTQLKSSSSCPKDFLQEDIGENSSSGVSSDIESQSDHIVLISSTTDDNLRRSSSSLSYQNCNSFQNDKPSASQNSNLSSTQKPSSSVLPAGTAELQSPVKGSVTSDGDVFAWNRRNFRKSAVSLSNLPPPVETGETDAESEHTDSPLNKESDFDLQSDSDSRQSNKINEAQKTVISTDENSPSNCSVNKSIDESLKILRLQVDSLGLAAVNEVDVFTELVPPPPEFAAPSLENNTPDQFSLAIAPPPQFCDDCPSMCNHTSTSMMSSNHCGHSVHRETAYTKSYNYMDYSYRTSLSSRLTGSPQHSPPLSKAKRSEVSRSSQSINVQIHSPNNGNHPLSHMIQSSNDYGMVHALSGSDIARMKPVQKEFRQKPLHEWTASDVANWLDSLFLPEYKARFAEAGITGAKLANMDNNDLMGLGVKQVGHRLNMERSLSRYLK